MQIKEEPRSPSVNHKYRTKDRHHSRVRVKQEPEVPRKRKHRDKSTSHERDKAYKKHKHHSSSSFKRERKSNSRSKSRSPNQKPSKSSHRKLKRERSLSDGEIAEPVSRWGPPSEAAENSRNNSGGHNRENNSRDGNPGKPKEQPNLKLSGALAKETNMYRGVLINYSEPPEAKVPKKRWRFYPFKGTEEFKPLYMHRQSAYLIGRDKNICDMPLLHPSISKQHAVLQYRSVPYTKPDGSQSRAIRPYIIDLNSPNGTFLNGVPVEPQRYIELKEKDVVKFAFSSRDYVLLHDKSKDEEDDELTL